jgi:hypothetical protein
VRIIQRSNAAGSIGPRRVIAPQEITALKKGQMTTATLGVEFQSASDRDGALQARFDIKSDRGSNPVDIKPPLGELLVPCRMSESDFDSAMERLQGFQRVESSFVLSTEGKSLEQAHQALPLVILKHAALSPVSRKAEWKEGMLRLAAKLPASKDPVFVVVSCSSITGSGNITVCCDNALATNSLVEELKHAL